MQQKSHAGLRKAASYQAAGTNIELLGSELERNCKKTAAQCEEQWHHCGKQVGLDIWRIEDFKVVPWPKNLYGQFYDGDSYIVLHTYGKPGNYSYDVFFWLGQYTSIDEAGTAAYKTVELDTFFDDKPVEFREVEGYESEKFVSLFPHGVRILNGGVASGFNHVEEQKFEPRLMQAKGKKDIRMSQVPLARSSLNSGDVFILDLGKKVFQWNGSKSGGMERMKAAQLCRAIDDERDGVEVVVLEESETSGNDEFWNPLGGHGPVASASAGGSDDTVHSTKKLFKLSDAGGSLSFSQVAEGHLNRGSLNSSDVYVLDAGQQIFLWIGKGASAVEKKSGISVVQKYIAEHNRPKFISICTIMEGGENEVFEAAFH